MIAELPVLTNTRLSPKKGVSATGVASFLLGVSFFCWAHVVIARTDFPGSPAPHDVALYPSEILGLVVAMLGASRLVGKHMPSRLVLIGGGMWLVASLVATWTARDPGLAVAWIVALLVAICVVLTGVDRSSLGKGMAVGALGSFPVMLFQIASQTTWPIAAIEGWQGGELSAAVKGAAVLGDQRWLRPYGLTPHPNIAGGLAAVACVVLAAAWVRERQAWQLPVAAVAFAETLLSFSRSAWIGALIGLAVVVVVRRGNIRPVLVAVAIPMVIFAVAFGQLALQRTEATGTLEADSLSQRIYLVQTAVQFWRQKPLFGIGPAQFNQQEVDTYGPGFIPEPVHNAVFLVLAETGLVGLIGAVLLVGGIAGRTKRESDWDSLAASLAVMSPLMLDHYLLSSAVGLTLVAAVLAHDVSGRPHMGPSHKPWSRAEAIHVGRSNVYLL